MLINNLAVSTNQLLRFLNCDVSDHFERTIRQSKTWRGTRQALLRCVDLTLAYKNEWDGLKGDPREKVFRWNLVSRLHGDVTDELHRILSNCQLSVFPGSVKYGKAERDEGVMQTELDQTRLEAVETSLTPHVAFTKEGEVPDIPNLYRVFSEEGFTLIASPQPGNYALTFVKVLCDPVLGIERIFRCDHCGKIGLAKYRRPQRFCSKPAQCSAKYHNERKAPQMASYMREYRRVKKQMRSRRRKGRSK